MEPVTHILTGACLSRTGLNRRAAYTTLAMAIAAELPDIDTLWSLRGSVAGFQHHRGITHTFVGIPFEAALVVAAIYGLHRWRTARAQRLVPPPHASQDDHVPAPHPLTAAPVRWGLLYLFTLLALLSHLLLDYTNNYGIRPFFPFNPHWYAASIVFIFDPLIFLLLLAALVLPAIFGLVGSEVGARRQPFRGRSLAISALLGIVALWTFRAVEHNRAVQLAQAQSVAVPSESLSTPPSDPQSASAPDAAAPSEPPPQIYLTPQRVLASPDPLNPFHWSAAMDYGPFYQLAEIDTRSGSVSAAYHTLLKPSRSAAVLAAEASPLGRAFIDWSPMPLVVASLPEPGAPRVVTFRDPRFMGGWLREHSTSPLTATVELDSDNHVIDQAMDGPVQQTPDR
jgi:inner membrane protein